MASGVILGVGAPLAAPSAGRASPAPTRPASFPGRISGFETVSESSGYFGGPYGTIITWNKADVEFCAGGAKETIRLRKQRFLP